MTGEIYGILLHPTVMKPVINFFKQLFPMIEPFFPTFAHDETNDETTFWVINFFKPLFP